MIGDNYQTKTLTIPAKNYSRTLNILVLNYYGADQEGYFMRELEIGFSKPYEVKEMGLQIQLLIYFLHQRIGLVLQQSRKELGVDLGNVR